MKKIVFLPFAILLIASQACSALATPLPVVPTFTPQPSTPQPTGTGEVEITIQVVSPTPNPTFKLIMPEKKGEYNGLATAENSVLVVNEKGEVWLVSWARAKDGVEPFQTGGSIKWIMFYSAVDERYHVVINPDPTSGFEFSGIGISFRGAAALESAQAHQFISALEDRELASQVQTLVDQYQTVSYCFEPHADPSIAYHCRNH